jgi:hypothetical protein
MEVVAKNTKQRRQTQQSYAGSTNSHRTKSKICSLRMPKQPHKTGSNNKKLIQVLFVLAISIMFAIFFASVVCLCWDQCCNFDDQERIQGCVRAQEKNVIENPSSTENDHTWKWGKCKHNKKTKRRERSPTDQIYVDDWNTDSEGEDEDDSHFAHQGSNQYY